MIPGVSLAALYRKNELEMSVKTGKLTDRLLVGSQPTTEDLERLREAGVATVINLRTEGEQSQPFPPAAEREAAVSAGLAYHHIPVNVASLDAEQVRAVKTAIAKSEGPVYMHCGAGQRACAMGLLAVDEAGAGAEARASELGFPMTDEALIRFVRTEITSERRPAGDDEST